MTNEFTTDPSLVNAEYAGAAADTVETAIEEADRQEALAEAQAQQEQAKKDEEKAIATTPDGREMAKNDPRRDGTSALSPADVGAELTAAFTGGGRDTVSMGLTAVERFQDMFSGEMEREIEDKGYYTPEFNPLGGDLNPITTTWWGNMIRGTVHFGTSAVALALAAKGILALAPAGLVAGATKLTGLARLGAAAKGGSLKAKFAMSSIKGATAGGATDLLSEYSQDHNALGALEKTLGDRFPQFLSGLATKDHDSPWVKTVKNVVEGLGIGEFFEVVGLAVRSRGKGKPRPTKAKGDTDKRVDGYFTQKEKEAAIAEKAALDDQLTAELAGEYFSNTNGKEFRNLSKADQLAFKKEYVKKHPKKYKDWTPPDETPAERAVRKSRQNKENVDEQVLEEGKAQMDSPEYGAYKADDSLNQSTQGTAVSQGRPLDIMKQVREKRRNGFDGDLGSTDSATTVAQVRRSNEISDISGKELNQVLRKALGDQRFRRLYESVKAEGKNAREVFRDAYKGFMEFTEGRNTSNMTLDQYFKPIDDDITFRSGGKDSMEAWSMENVVMADLVNASNFSIMRDYAIAAREANNVIDVWDVDGPVRQIRDRLIYGIMNVKRSRMLISAEFRKLRTVEGEDIAREAYKKRMSSLYDESKSAVDMMFKIAQEAPSRDLQDALLEAFSMSNKIQNWEDLHRWMRTKLMGGEFGGKNQTGMLIKELQGVMVNSILTGPKTPIRAIMGTSIAGFARPIAQSIGGAMTFDGQMMREGLSTLSAMMEATPEALKLFFSKLNSYWTGDVATMKTRYSGYEKAEADFQAMKTFVEKYGTDGEQAAMFWANTARSINNNSFFSYSTRIMAATDDAFGHIMARARARQKAMQASMEVQMAKTGEVPVVDKQLMKDFENRFYDEMLDEDGNIDFGRDAALKYAQEEATMTRDLSGWSKGLETMFNKYPMMKPFFLFARTGINGIELSFKHMPLLNRIVKDEQILANATPEMANNKELLNIGISNAFELRNAQAISRGRQAIGTAIITMASMMFMTDRLHGNGPMNQSQLRAWKASGWVPRSIKIGDTWVSYDALEPFNSLLAYVADVGDNMELMGEDWASEKLARLIPVMMQTTVSKSYLAGVKQLVDLMTGGDNPIDQGGAIIGNLMNNQIPLAGLRNEIGKVVNPMMKELNRDLASTLRNRNQWAEMLDGDNELPIRYDILTGEPLKEHSFWTRVFNAVSPITLNLQNSPGRTLLWNSGYDVNIAAYANPDGVDLKNYPEVRSMYQKAMGSQNLEAKLDALAARPDVQESIREMNKDRNGGFAMIEPKSYRANELIAQLFRQAQRTAWAQVSKNPEVQRLILAQKNMEAAEKFRNRGDYQGAREKVNQAQDLLKLQPK